jgi:hypothetical protein
VHQTSIDRYVRLNKDIWRVVCARCGVLADDLGRYGAAYLGSLMAKRECLSLGAVTNDRLAWNDSHGNSLSDKQALDAWSDLLEWSTASDATVVEGLDGA